MPQAINNMPVTCLKRMGLLYANFSNKTNKVSIITHIIFITPRAKSVNIKAQQQPTQ